MEIRQLLFISLAPDGRIFLTTLPRTLPAAPPDIMVLEGDLPPARLLEAHLARAETVDASPGTPAEWETRARAVFGKLQRASEEAGYHGEAFEIELPAPWSEVHPPDRPGGR